MTSKICSECGTEQDESFKFCKNCGALLLNTDNDLQSDDKEEQHSNSNNIITCQECGTEHETFAKFCRNCGASFFNETVNENTLRCRYCGCELNNESFCPDCGKSTGIKFCPKCRQKIVNEDYCSVCGYRINPDVKICNNCGGKIDALAKVCIHCGSEVMYKNPHKALFLSLIVPGAGQLYNDQINKGVKIIILNIISLILIFVFIGVFFTFLIWIYAMYDANVSAKAINRGEILEDRIF